MAIPQLLEYFARYPYLPRVAGPVVLLQCVEDGLNSTAWERESFAYADAYDEAAARYVGLAVCRQRNLDRHAPTGLLVKASVARAQIGAEGAASGGGGVVDAAGADTGTAIEPGQPSDGLFAPAPGATPAVSLRKRFHATAVLETERVGRDAGRIAEEVIGHIAALVGARVTVTLEISAEAPDGIPDSVVRTVTINCNELRLQSYEFEKE